MIIEINEGLIIERLRIDGDLREAEGDDLEIFEVHESDDLGFYQQACEYLISKLAANSLSIDRQKEKIFELTRDCEGYEFSLRRLRRERDKAREYAVRLDAATKLDSGKRAQAWLHGYSYKGHSWEDQTRLAREYAKERGWEIEE